VEGSGVVVDGSFRAIAIYKGDVSFEAIVWETALTRLETEVTSLRTLSTFLCIEET
jgi:hypothetical protein